jgi:SWI/SNF-related matrix-associated actin-dependent regulator 1 of chromatin subfamily A
MLRTRLFDFQREDVRRINEFNGRCLLANEVGLGKTLISLYYAWRYLPDDPPGPVVVVVPAHLKVNWSREAEKHLGIHVEILSGQRCPSDKQLPINRSQIYVVNYDVLCPPRWKAGTAPPDNSWLAFLSKQKPRLVICDEAQYAKTVGTMRTRAVKLLCKNVRHALMLTGTPLANKPGDLWTLLNILHPKMWPSRFDFLCNFTHMSKRWWGWNSRGAKNLDVLHSLLLKSCMIRRRKVDVISQLPSVTYTVLPIEVNLREYRKAEADYMGWLAKKHPHMAASAAKAADLTRLNGLKQLAGQLKVKSVIDWTNDLLEETGGKLLLGCVHHSVGGPLMDAFGDSAVAVNGKLTAKQKQVAFDRFNLDPRARVLVGNLQAAGTGWSCISTSDVAICELPWVPSEVEQFSGRVHGIERGLPDAAAHIRFLVAEDTIESDLCQIIQTKRTWAAQAVDGETNSGGLDVYDQIKSLMRKRQTGR